LLVPILLGMTGMAIDIGTYADNRRELQNAADSIALAAAQDLPNSTDATTSGNAWATKNGVDVGDMTLTVSGGTTAPTVTVQLTESHQFHFLQIFGIASKNVGARAAAVKVSFGGGAGIVPWSVTQATVDASGNGSLVTMKYDSTGAENGNFGAIRIDGPGANTYNTSVMYGSTTVACAETAPNCTTGACPGTYPSVCSETSPECDGPECSPQTGNLIGPTRTGVDFRMNYTMTSCDTIGEAFGPVDANGIYHLNPDCNPWTDGPGKCLTNTSICSRRVIIIPVVDDFGNGTSDPATIQRFALIFLEGYDSGKCQGNSCEIKGRFIEAALSPRGLAGSYDPEASIHFARLSE
ncbi:MAG TPA: pilus assembly protein TadG-related protein, partial [Dehalococcoidia bacterium]